MRRMETDVTVDELLLKFLTHKPQLWWLESELISKSFGPFLKKLMHEKRIYTTLDPVSVHKDKETRARAIQGRMSHKRVHFPVYASWWPDAKNQLLKFPFGTHDDFVDWLAHIGMGLLKEIPAAATHTPARVIEVGSPAWILAQTRLRARNDDRKKAVAGW
jgi:predicted phage terminase large subunit-like protein